MFERFTEKAIKVIMLAQEEARRLGHNFVGTEQVLLGLIGEGTGIAAKTLKSMGVNLKDARIEVEKIIEILYNHSMFKYYGKYAPYLFLLPAGIVLLIFFFIPFFQTFLLSFQDYSTSIYHPSWVGFENYVKLFHNPIFYKVLWNTFIYLFVAVPVLAIFPLFVAILINQKIRGVTLYKIIIYLPVIVSIVVAAIAFKWLYADQGILNYIVTSFGLKPIGWLTDPKWALFQNTEKCCALGRNP